MRIGQGVDVHALVPGRPLKLGGVEVPYDRGLEGHSDGDALLHAIASSLLGALALGDLGDHFPSSDARWKGADSRRILAEVARMVRERRHEVVSIDTTILAQEPRMGPHKAAMCDSIARCLGVPAERVSVKAASTDHLGMIGRGEGIACFAVALLAPRGEGS